MNAPSFKEDHISQVPALQLLINLGYKYIPPQEALELRGGKKSQVLWDVILKEQLGRINSITRKGKEYSFSESNINAAVVALKDLPIQDGFLNANAAFYDLITLGKSFEQSIEGDKKSYTLQYIDWENPHNNIFHVTEEYSVLRSSRSDTYRPDIVLFINGIPMGIIECKSPALKGTKTPTELAIEQHIRNFGKSGIRSLYVYSNVLLSIAVNDGSYATTGTSKEFWSKWKEQFSNGDSKKQYYNGLSSLKNKPISGDEKDELFAERFRYVRSYFDGLEQEERVVTIQDELLYSICKPSRFLDLIRNYTLFDEGHKKDSTVSAIFCCKRNY